MTTHVTQGATSSAVAASAAILLPRKILVVVDFNAHTGAVLDTTFALAERLDATVHLVHACGSSGLLAGGRKLEAVHSDAYRSALARLHDLAEGRRTSHRLGNIYVREGDPVRGVAEVAAHLEADLIVVDTYHAGLARTSPESFAEALVGHAPCSTLVLCDRTGARS